MFIKHIIDNDSKVTLITRPRRFGKTLNMSMLRYFFDCNKNDIKEYFNGLKIMEQVEEYTSKLGRYPCIYLTFKDVSDQNYQNMLLDMKEVVKDFNIEESEEEIEVKINLETVITGIENNEDNIWG